MDPISIGPLMLPAPALIALLAIICAFITAGLWQRRHQQPLDWPVYLLIISTLLGGRLAFVLRYHEQYPTLLSMLDMRDGGWWWPGMLASAVLAMLLLLWRRPALTAGLLVTASSVALTVTLSVAALSALQPERPVLPALTLHQEDGTPVSLRQQAQGVTVINLWASWCPPCRREMPILAAAQLHYPQVRFILANQGESPAQVADYLKETGLSFQHSLLDPYQDMARHSGNRGLPTTLVYNNQGEEVARHFGPVSAASLHHLIAEHLNEPLNKRVK